MQRTIEINPKLNDCREGDLFYRGKHIDYLMDALRKHFNLDDGEKYRITIVEGKRYRFAFLPFEKGYGIYDTEKNRDHEKEYISFICKKEFDKLFFVPKKTKRYDITVKKVE